MNAVQVVLHPEVAVPIVVCVARSEEEVQLQARGIAPTDTAAETEQQLDADLTVLAEQQTSVATAAMDNQDGGESSISDSTPSEAPAPKSTPSESTAAKPAASDSTASESMVPESVAAEAAVAESAPATPGAPEPTASESAAAEATTATLHQAPEDATVPENNQKA